MQKDVSHFQYFAKKKVNIDNFHIYYVYTVHAYGCSFPVHCALEKEWELLSMNM